MNAWSREDIIIAYALYCVTPLGKINPSNKVIQKVSRNTTRQSSLRKSSGECTRAL